MSKEKQTNDSQNMPIAMAVDGSVGKLHKAASVKGITTGNNSKPTSNGGK